MFVSIFARENQGRDSPRFTMRYPDLNALCAGLSEELNKYQHKIYADSEVVRFEIELMVQRGKISFQTIDNIITCLKRFDPESHPPFSFSFLIRDQNGNKDLFRFYPYETLPGWVMKKLIE
jgi:hypothetical protein